MATALTNLCNAIVDRDVDIFINLLGGPKPLESHSNHTQSLNDQRGQHTPAFKSGVLGDNIVKLANAYDFDGVFFVITSIRSITSTGRRSINFLSVWTRSSAISYSVLPARR